MPGESYSFATLRDAQALGDLQVLKRRGRRALRVHLGADIDAGAGRRWPTRWRAKPGPHPQVG